MSLTPDEEKALHALTELGLPEKVVRRAILQLRDRELEARENWLLEHLAELDPEAAARALDQLAGGVRELARDYEETL